MDDETDPELPDLPDEAFEEVTGGSGSCLDPYG
jgi:hypothetical protein